jgi:hypothetical protein
MNWFTLCTRMSEDGSKHISCELNGNGLWGLSSSSRVTKAVHLASNDKHTCGVEVNLGKCPGRTLKIEPNHSISMREAPGGDLDIQYLWVIEKMGICASHDPATNTFRTQVLDFRYFLAEYCGLFDCIFCGNDGRSTATAGESVICKLGCC